MTLAAARTLAWALLLLGWLQLGALGHWTWPLVAGGLLPIALWLLVIGNAQHVVRDRLTGPAMLRAAVLGTGWLTAGALAWPTAAPTLAAAVSWGLLVVAASRVVRSLRYGRAPAPVLPAAAGGALAWAASLSTAATCGFVAGAAVSLAVLAGAGRETRGCRSGLFDCALPAFEVKAWRSAADALSGVARWTMLPMMATLAPMGDWCSARIGLNAGTVVGLHLAAMLLPPLLLPRARRARWLVLPLLAALLSPWLLPGLDGVMAASLSCAVAWGLAWRAQLAARGGTRPVATPELAWGPAALAFVTGIVVGHAGPAALAWLLAAFAAAGLAGALAAERNMAKYIAKYIMNLLRCHLVPDEPSPARRARLAHDVVRRGADDSG